MVPCVLYGGKELKHLQVTNESLRRLIYTPHFHKVMLNIDGATHEAIIKAIQFHPVTDAVLHIDFQELVAGQSVMVELPVRLTGTAQGVRAGGRLLHKMRRLKVRAVPEKLVDEIVIDVTNLEVGKSIRVRDIALDGVSAVVEGATPVCSVEVTRALRQQQGGK